MSERWFTSSSLDLDLVLLPPLDLGLVLHGRHADELPGHLKKSIEFLILSFFRS